MFERNDLSSEDISMITTAGMPPYNFGNSVKKEHSSIKTSSPASMPQQPLLQGRGMSSANASQNSVSSSSSSLDQAHNPHHPNSRVPLRPVSSQSSSAHAQGVMNITHSNVPGSWSTGAPGALPPSDVPSNISAQGDKISTATNSRGVKKTKGSAPAKKRQNSKVGPAADRRKGNAVTEQRKKRLKRLERNRESARLSRRRRKQYLEILEKSVTHLSVEMDQGRREHAARAIETVLEKRREIMRNNPVTGILPKLDIALNRASLELSVLSTFYMQQLKSFAMPAHSKFVFWLTLQGDTYFRGGRAASERLSAARIGERVSTNIDCLS
jgi:hypothetical protein